LGKAHARQEPPDDEDANASQDQDHQDGGQDVCKTLAELPVLAAEAGRLGSAESPGGLISRLGSQKRHLVYFLSDIEMPGECILK
jgi:hypothetical protein